MYLECRERFSLEPQLVTGQNQVRHIGAIGQVGLVHVKHLVVPHVQCLQQVQSSAQTAVQLGDGVVADVEVDEGSVACQRLRRSPPQSVVGHVQAVDVRGEVLGNRTEAEVAAVRSTILH